MSQKVLLVGWDAADWKIIQPLMDYGLMPATQRLVEGGVMSSIRTLQPALSPMLWTSIATGKRPHKHGILGFTEPVPGGKGLRPVTNLSRKTKAIWNILCQNGKHCNVVGWWPSHPAEPINGVMVSNHYQRAPGPIEKGWPVQPGTIHPERLVDTLAELRVHPQDIGEDEMRAFVPLGHTIDQKKDNRMNWVVQIIADCGSIQAAATWLMQNEPWDFMAVYFDGCDHFCHGYIKYHPPRLPWIQEEDYELFKNVVSAGYVLHDMMLARLVELAGPETTIILMSDHGFHPDHLRRKELPSEPAGPAAEHREHGIFVVSGPGIRRDELIHGTTLLDITPTILTLFGLPVGEDMDGRVLAEIFEEPPAVETLPSWDDVSGEDGRHPPDTELDSGQSEEALEQLIALGYIERPSGDVDEAAREAGQEQQYNLARSLMAAGRHGDAIPIFSKLYAASPLEFRFGVHLATCLQAMYFVDELATLVRDLRARWRKAAAIARERLREITEIARERRQKLKEIQKARREVAGDDTSGTEEPRTPFEKLFSRPEQRVVKKIRGIARGNDATLDYLDGWVAMSRGEYEQAANLFLKAESSQAHTAGHFFHLGEAYRKMRDYARAREMFDRMLEIDPDNASAWLGIARVHSGLRQSEEGIAAARKALGLNYHLAPAHYCIGVCQVRQGKYDEAIESFERALELNPNFAEAHRRLCRLYRHMLRDEQRAREHDLAATELREVQLEHGRRRILGSLPDFDSIDYDAALPVFPKTTILPRLADGIIDTPERNEVPVWVVSGLPRSGTSMMMQMLAAGGIEAWTDNLRGADENNPRGYLELEKVKQLPQQNDWLDEAAGKAIKVVSPLIPYLPQRNSYRVIVMRRDLDEILESQSAMLQQLGKTGAALEPDQLKTYLNQQDQYALARLKAHRVPHLVVEHADAIADPQGTAAPVAEFLQIPVDVEAMYQAIDPNLHRQRGSAPTA